MDDVSTGAAKYLSQFTDVTDLLGSFSFTDPVTGNQGRPYLFADNILVDMKGTSASAVVLSDFGGWQAPPQLGGQRFRRLRVDIYTDPQRDSQGNVNQSDATTRGTANTVFNAVHRRLHRRDPDTVEWGDMVTFACQLLTEPPFDTLPDGDRMMFGSAVYGVSFGGWTDALA